MGNMVDFGRPNAEIGRKMASGRLLFLALYYRGPKIIQHKYHNIIIMCTHRYVGIELLNQTSQ